MEQLKQLMALAGQTSCSKGSSGAKKLESGRSLVRPWRWTISRPRKILAKIQHLERGKQFSVNSVYNGGVELMTMNINIVGL